MDMILLYFIKESEKKIVLAVNRIFWSFRIILNECAIFFRVKRVKDILVLIYIDKEQVFLK